MMITTLAIYIRLSLEDDDLVDGKLESESITNQRNLLWDYIQNTAELRYASVLEFCDDGYSGKNFDRPGVKAMLEAAQRGTIQCILVKDLSRFGRDYITVGNYISRVFPFLGIRFIAVNDHFDSARQSDIDSIDTSFKALIYDLYSRDLSRKVRSAKKVLATRGVYINPVAPYGYKKDPEDRHRLIPDPATADVIRRIFTMAADGVSTELIARTLNAECIPTPSSMKAGTSSEHENWKDNYWRQSIVWGIIRDRQYIGSNVFGKRVRDQIGVRRQLTAKLEDWIVVDDCHEPLVSKALFQKAQEALGGEYKQDGKHVKRNNPLRKKVYCGVCGYAIIRRGKKERYYRCETPRTVPGMTCSEDVVYESEILDLVEEAIHTQAQCAVELKHLSDSQKEYHENMLQALQKDAKYLQTLQQQITEESRKLYEEYALDGTLSRDAYGKQKALLLKRREAVYQSEAEIKSRIAAVTAQTNQFVEKYQDHTALENLTEDIAADLLHRVTIWPNRRIEISLNYLDEIPSAIVPKVQIDV